MQTVVVTPPAAPVLSTASARARLNIPLSVDDDSLAALVAAATEAFDGPDGRLGRCLGQQTLELQSEFFPGCGFPRDLDHDRWRGYAPHGIHLPTIKLLCPPVASISSVNYVDPDGADRLLDPATYVLTGRLLTPAFGMSWPSARYQPAAVRIRYLAGYAPGSVPSKIIQAIVMTVAKLNAMMKSDPTLTQETVIGVSSMQWQMSADAVAIYDTVASSLLSNMAVIDY